MQYLQGIYYVWNSTNRSFQQQIYVRISVVVHFPPQWQIAFLPELDYIWKFPSLRLKVDFFNFFSLGKFRLRFDLAGFLLEHSFHTNCIFHKSKLWIFLQRQNFLIGSTMLMGFTPRAHMTHVCIPIQCASSHPASFLCIILRKASCGHDHIIHWWDNVGHSKLTPWGWCCEFSHGLVVHIGPFYASWRDFCLSCASLHFWLFPTQNKEKSRTKTRK